MLKQMSNAIRIQMTHDYEAEHLKYPAMLETGEHRIIEIHEAYNGVPRITIIQPQPKGDFFMQVEYLEGPIWYRGVGNPFWAVEEIVDWFIETE